MERFSSLSPLDASIAYQQRDRHTIATMQPALASSAVAPAVGSVPKSKSEQDLAIQARVGVPQCR